MGILTVMGILAVSILTTDGRYLIMGSLSDGILTVIGFLTIMGIDVYSDMFVLCHTKMYLYSYYSIIVKGTCPPSY